jgi:hypothetical protein
MDPSAELSVAPKPPVVHGNEFRRGLSAVRIVAAGGGSCVRPGEGISPQRASIPAHADGPSRNNISALPWFFPSRGRPAPEPAQNQARINGSVAAEDGFFALARMPRRIPPVWRHGETLGSTSSPRRLRKLLPRSPCPRRRFSYAVLPASLFRNSGGSRSEFSPSCGWVWLQRQ